MTSHPNFTEQQVAAAIRAGLREGRRQVNLSPTEAEDKAATYRSNLAHYRQRVQTSLDAGDYLQAAEKSWGSYAQTLKAIGADHQLSITHHASIIGVAGRLADLAGQSDPQNGVALTDGLHIARSLHTHFYENDLPDTTVVTATSRVGEAIDLMQELFANNGNGAEESQQEATK